MGFLKKLRGRSAPALWEMEDRNAFLIAMLQRVSEKSRYGEDLQALTGPERVFLVTGQLEAEVNNGGFDQYLWNSSGDLANEAADAFAAIGAEKTAELCRRVMALFGGVIPGDQAARQNRLEELGEAAERQLADCDAAFYAYPEDLSARNYAYLLEHKESFPAR